MRFVYTNEFASIEKINEDLTLFGQKEGVDAKVLASVSVVLDEIVTNILKYAYEDSCKMHSIEMEIVRRGQKLHVQVIDDGKIFNPTHYHAMKMGHASSVEATPVGGVGIRIVKSLVKDLRYERKNERNFLSFTKDL